MPKMRSIEGRPRGGGGECVARCEIRTYYLTSKTLEKQLITAMNHGYNAFSSLHIESRRRPQSGDNTVIQRCEPIKNYEVVKTIINGYRHIKMKVTIGLLIRHEDSNVHEIISTLTSVQFVHHSSRITLSTSHLRQVSVGADFL